MRVTIVGSGTLLPDGDRGSAAHLIQTDGCAILLDCGAGSVHGMARLGLPWRDLTHLAISHFHTDHVGDVAALFWAFRHAVGGARSAPLTVLGPPGTRRWMTRLTRTFGGFLRAPGFPVEVAELERRDRFQEPRGRFTLESHPTRHTERSIAFRVQSGTSTVSYTGDAGPDSRLFTFFGGSDLVISECAESDPPTLDTHLSPTHVAQLGQLARPGRIVTTHVYPPLAPESVPELVRRAGWDGPVVAGYDGWSTDL